MKKRKFAEGGEFELSPEALASGLRMGRNSNIRDADREAAIAEVERAVAGAKNFKALSDQEAANMMGREVITPAQRAAESSARATPRAAPRATPDRIDNSMNEQEGSGRGVSNPAPSRGNENDYSMNTVNGTGGGQAARAPSRGDYSRPGPIGGLMQMLSAKNNQTAAARRRRLMRDRPLEATPMKKGGSVSAASKRADGCCVKGKTKGKMVGMKSGGKC